jgi:hypothetical protein
MKRYHVVLDVRALSGLLSIQQEAPLAKWEVTFTDVAGSKSQVLEEAFAYVQRCLDYSHAIPAVTGKYKHPVLQAKVREITIVEEGEEVANFHVHGWTQSCSFKFLGHEGE